jgi:hypothetical protein
MNFFEEFHIYFYKLAIQNQLKFEILDMNRTIFSFFIVILEHIFIHILFSANRLKMEFSFTKNYFLLLFRYIF